MSYEHIVLPVAEYIKKSASYKSSIRKAKKDLKKYSDDIKQKFKMTDAYFMRGKANLTLENYDDAIEDFTKALRSNTHKYNALVYRGIAKKGNYYIKQAALDFNKSIKLDPKEPWAYFQRSLLLHDDLEESELALEDLSQTVKLNPRDDMAYSWLGKINYAINDSSAACKNMKKAMKLNPDNEDTYIFFAEYNIGNENYERAINNLDEVIKINPKKSAPFRLRAICKMALKDYKSAAQDFSEALRIYPEKDFPYYDCGKVRLKCKDYRGAIKVFNEVIKSDAKNAKAYYYRGLCKHNLGMKRACCLDWKTALNLGYRKQATKMILKHCDRKNKNYSPNKYILEI